MRTGLTGKQEFAGINLPPYCVPNDPSLPVDSLPVTIGGIRPENKMPENMVDWAGASTPDFQGHGTGVASLAAGRTLGVANRARLYAIKYKNAIRRETQTGEGLPPAQTYYQQRGMRPAAV